MLPTGLTSAEVSERRRQGLGNQVLSDGWAQYRGIVVRNLATWFNALVVPAAIALFQLEEYRGAIAVSGMLVVNTILGLSQEIYAKIRLDRLTLVAATRVQVLRDGMIVTIPVEDVVKDDLMPLAVGDTIVADGSVLQSRFLEVDEALLTGEADPVPRSPGERLLAGSFCVAGEGLYRAEKVGAQATAQQIAQQARLHSHAAGPIQIAIDQIVRLLSYVAIALCGMYLVHYWWVPFPKTELAQMVAATITSMVPQGLVLTTTLALTLGAIRLTRGGTVVQRLDAVEAMAAVDVLCLDKTGTLTTNRLQLEYLEALSPDLPDPIVRERLRLFVSAAVDRTNKVLAALRDALGETDVQKIGELPFKAQNRFSAVVVKDQGKERTLVLGASEAVLTLLEESSQAQVESIWQKQLPSGLRLLLVAETTDSVQLEQLVSMKTLRPLALIGLRDEVRPEAIEALSQLQSQGIAFKVISGDNPHTVRVALAHSQLPISDEHIVSGEDLKKTTHPDELIQRCSVFGRVSPQQKLEIITSLQKQGRFVAMLGDGVNDVLAIKKADLGIAMGAGSTASKTVAGLVLLNNDFNVLPMAMEEARIAVHNLRRAGKLFLAKNVYTLFLIACTSLIFGLVFPYLPQQVTLLNFLTIGLPVVVIALGRTSGGATNRSQFIREIVYFAVSTGLVIGAASALLFIIAAWSWHDAPTLQRTLLLALLVLLGLHTVLRVMYQNLPTGSLNDRLLFTVIGLAIPLLLIAIYRPWAADFFQLQPLSLQEWGWVLALGIPFTLLLSTLDAFVKPGSKQVISRKGPLT
ncbi:MAG TPA: cation-translocating P-type ATPase [Gemmatales bacterium]|nr:cation-translocating P-type ATPase [Gemmatales bacterium]